MNSSYHKTICLDFGSEAFYQECLEEPALFKSHLNAAYQAHPELFPASMAVGWSLHGYTERSKKRCCS